MVDWLRSASLLVLVFSTATTSWAIGNYPGNALRVNGVDVSYQRYMGLYLEHQRSTGVAIGARGDQLALLTRLRKEAMDLLIEQELLIQAAEARGIKVLPEEIEAAFAEVSEPFNDKDEFMRRLETEGYTEDSYREHLRRMIAASKYLDEVRADAMNVSDEELETYYRENELRLTLPEQVRVRHILLSWKPLGQPDDRAALREQMDAILTKARAGEDFADLAREYSDDSSAQNGGDVGFFHRGQMVPAFEAAAFSLQPGEISDIVETPFGVHILKQEAHKDARLLPLEEIREPLRDHIREEKITRVEEDEKARLRQAAEIEILIPIERAEKK
jgi:peptidyl-prolyl cis-trans isomerase C